jgi:hypothetical protein
MRFSYHYRSLLSVLISFSVLLIGCDEDQEVPTAITRITPRQGAEGMRIKVQGSAFGEAITDHAITFNGQAAVIEEVNNEEMVVIVPKDVTTGPVRLSLQGVTYEGPIFTVLPEKVELSGGFSLDDGIATIGNAFVYESELQEGLTVLRLTPPKLRRVGIGYYGARVPVVGGFETTFDFQIHEVGGPAGPNGERGAEGLAFIIQNQGIEARGHLGASMGYAGIRNAVVVEFDVYQSEASSEFFGDPNGNHISVQTNTNPGDRYGETGAEIYHSLGHTTDETHPNLPDLIASGSEKHSVRIGYTPGEPGTLTVSLDNEPVLSVAMKLSDYINTEDGKAYIGFTASTNQTVGWASHDILNWSFDPK